MKLADTWRKVSISNFFFYGFVTIFTGFFAVSLIRDIKSDFISGNYLSIGSTFVAILCGILFSYLTFRISKIESNILKKGERGPKRFLKLVKKHKSYTSTDEIIRKIMLTLLGTLFVLLIMEFVLI